MLGTLLQTATELTAPLQETIINKADSVQIKKQEIIHEITTNPTSFFQKFGEEALQFGMKVLAALAIYFIGAYLIKYLRKILRATFERRKTEKTIATFLMSLCTIIAYTVLVLTVVGTLGINTTSLAALLAAGGMAIGMALSGTVQNFAGGLMLLIFKPFKVGDFIEAQGYKGYVTAVSIVSTKITTTDNRVVVIPNGSLSNGNIDNYSAEKLRRVEWTVSVEYGCDADGCIELMRGILLKDPRILDSKTKGAADIFIALSSMNENDISFVVRAWCKASDYWNVYFDHNKDFYTELPKAGFGFAYPHMDVTIKQ